MDRRIFKTTTKYIEEEIKLMIQQQRHKSKQSKEDLAKQLNDAKESGVIDRS